MSAAPPADPAAVPEPGPGGVNWAGNVVFGADRLVAPASVDEVRAAVTSARRVRAVGARHSFSAVADTEGTHVSLAGLPRTVRIDGAARTVTVDGGARYGDAAPVLHAAGWALANLASLPHLTVAGACATATHGSGAGLGNLATAVRGLELVTADGDVVTLTAAHDADELALITVGLGAFGVVTALTLAVEPAYDVAQTVHEGLPFDALVAGPAAVLDAAYSVSLFTTWATDRVGQVWCKRRVDAPAGAPPPDTVPAPVDRHPIAALDAAACTPQRGLPGPWHERLPHFRLSFTPSSGEELQSELFVDRAHTADAVGVLRALGPVLAPVLQIAEVRTVAADALAGSPCSGRDRVAFHFTWVRSWDAVRPVLARVEDALAPFAPVPHWGKLTTIDAATVHERLPRLADVARARARWDPAGRFRNRAVAELLG